VPEFQTEFQTRQVAFRPATFGPHTAALPPTAAVAAAPELADAELTNAAELRGKVAVARRGGCMIHEKARRVQRAGAAALLVVNTEPDPPVGMSAPDGAAEDIRIPVLGIGSADGAEVLAVLRAQVAVAFQYDAARQQAACAEMVRHVEDEAVRETGNARRFFEANELVFRRIRQLADPATALVRGAVRPHFNEDGVEAEREHVRREYLPGWAEGGWALTLPVERLWAGERDLEALAAGCDAFERAVVALLLGTHGVEGSGVASSMQVKFTGLTQNSQVDPAV
jgi:hypothetical protein